VNKFFKETLPAALKSKWYVWGLFFTVLALMIAYFVYAWTGHAPTTGPDQTNPWGPPVPGASSAQR
jgi:hypothetical protein